MGLLERRPLRRALRNWLERHRHPGNFALHMVGIPMTLVGVGLLFAWPWYWGSGAIVVGYFLQYLGHLVEGNDMGEWAAIKRCLGLPYVAVAPGREKKATDESS